MAQSKHRGDLFDPTCPTRTILDAIGDKWSAIVVLLLDDAPLRFNELARVAEPISFKMLTQTLRRLERDGFVSRTVGATRPPSVTYGLTKLGREIVPLLDALREWSETHISSVLTARTAFDRSTAA